jgi:hypothetical protein
MALNNRLSPQRRDWSALAFNGLPPGSGVLFEEVTLDQRIGSEAVALLIDPEADQMVLKGTLDLNLKTGIVATSYGPVLFLIWWIPPIKDGRPTAFYEQVMNPLYPNTSEVLRRVSEQSQLHVVLVDATGQVVTVFEFQNNFGFDKVCAGVDAVRVSWKGPHDFASAKAAYEEEYEVEDVLAGRYD